MKKKIVNFFKKFKKNKKTKSLVIKNNKSEVINFVNTSKNSNKIQTEQMEIKKMDALAKELVENYLKASRKSFFCESLFMILINKFHILVSQSIKIKWQRRKILITIFCDNY